MSYFAIEPLRVFVSSRCQDKVSFRGRKRPMSAVREELKKVIEGLRLDDEQLFEVWIHEDEAFTGAEKDSWSVCLDRARRADLVLVLYNGRAGWVGTDEKLGGKIGICHAEFAEAFHGAPSKVRTIQLLPVVKPTEPEDQRFQEYFLRQSVLGAQVKNGEEAIEQSKKACVAALLDLAHDGGRATMRGKFYAGDALAWSRLDYTRRRAVTTEVLRDALAGPSVQGDRRVVVRPLQGRRVGFVCDCIPAAMTTAAAREMVGQPFLDDHEFVDELDSRKNEVGPVHVIACHRGVSESQALRQLGFPEAIVVTAPFGVYVADDVQKIQMVFISNCRDETTTRQRTQEFLRWLGAQGEDHLLAERAAARRRISQAIQKEQSTE